MGIGTSSGGYYDDEFHHAASQWNPKYDDNKSVIQNAVDSQVKNTPMENDDDFRTPLEIDPNQHKDRVTDPTQMMKDKISGENPRFIFNDQGYIVDYDTDETGHGGLPWGVPDLPIVPIPKPMGGPTPAENE